MTPSSLAQLKAEPKEALVEKLARARAAMKSMREGTAHGVKTIKTVLLAAGGGGLSGFVSVKHPSVTLPGIGPVPTDVVIGGVLTLAAVFDLADGYEDDLLAFTAGMAGAAAAKKVAEMTLQKQGG
jgi:hypothetical protein